MKIRRVLEILSAELITGKDLLDEEIDYGHGSDLMSDVLAFVQNNILLLTGLIHPQVVRTAELLDIKAITIVRGKVPSDELIAMAKSRDIVLISTTHSLFTASGILYKHGLMGEETAHIEI